MPDTIECPPKPRDLLSPGNYSRIARISGLSVPFVSRVLRGERNPSPTTAAKIASAAGVGRLALDQWLDELAEQRRAAS